MISIKNSFFFHNLFMLTALAFSDAALFSQEGNSKPLSWDISPRTISQTPEHVIHSPAWIQASLVATLNKDAKPAKAQFAPNGSLAILENVPVAQSNQPRKGRLGFWEWNPESNLFSASPKYYERSESIVDFAIDNSHLFLATQGKILAQSITKNFSNATGKTTLLEYTHSTSPFIGGIGLQAFADGWLYFFLPEGNGVLKAINQKEIQIQGCGGLYRIRKDGSHLEVYCTGFASPLEGYFQDAQGCKFLIDFQVGKEGQPKGLGYYSIQQGSDFGFRSKDFLANFAMENPSQFAEGLPGKIGPSQSLKDFRSFSIFHYLGNGFPAELQDHCFFITPWDKKVLSSKARKTSAGVFLDKPSSFVEFKSNLEPSQMIQGPDGAIFVLCNSNANGANQEGAVIRLSFKGNTDELKGIKTLQEANQAATADFDGLLKLLEQFPEEKNTQLPNWFARHLPANKEPISKLTLDEEKSASLRAGAFTALIAHWDAEVQKTALALLDSGESILEVLAARALGDFSPTRDSASFNALLRHLGSDNIFFRREVILAIGKINAPGAADSLTNGALFYDGNDPLIWDAFTRGLEFTGNDGLDRLNSVGDSGVKKDLRKALDILASMRSETSLSALGIWLKNVNLTPGDKADLIRSLRSHSMNNQKPYLTLFQSMIESKPDKAEEKIAILESLRGLKEINSDRILKWIEECLKDESAETRKAAADTVRVKKVKNLKGPVSHKAFGSIRFLG